MRVNGTGETGSVSQLSPVAALERIAYLLERGREPTYRVRAFRNAADLVRGLPDDELAGHVERGTLDSLPGIGPATARVIAEAYAGERPAYLTKLEGVDDPIVAGGDALRAKLRGDLHSHSDWSDGGSPIKEMAEAAKALGHDYLALTDHSPRLTVAKGLSPDRLREQLDVVAGINKELAPFRILTGIEVDILDDGSLDQEPELLAELDVVVASVHSKLRMDAAGMTQRMVTAVSNPNVDVLGHCTGRIVVGKGRPESEFDADAVFGACRDHGVAVEINCRPERLDPPRRLLRQAVEMGCFFSIDTDAHAPGQLEWQPYGCARAVEAEVPVERVLNAMPRKELLAHVSG
jgi:putative hydrolase